MIRKFSFCTFKKVKIPFSSFKASVSFLILVFKVKTTDDIFPELT